MTKPLLGHFSKTEVSPKRYVHEFRVKDESGLLGVGETINADWFQLGQYVDTRSNSRGMGFTGVMKRHGFHGQDRSHGVSKTHRSMGSSGPGQGGGSRVYPGKKMAGNMGNEQVTVQNLKVLRVDADSGILVVKGEKNAIPFTHNLGLCELTYVHLIRRCERTERMPSEGTRRPQETMA